MRAQRRRLKAIQQRRINRIYKHCKGMTDDDWHKSKPPCRYTMRIWHNTDIDVREWKIEAARRRDFRRQKEIEE